MPRLYFENPMGCIYEHPDGYALLRYRPARRTGADVQTFLAYTGRLLQLRGWHKMLSDQRLLLPFTAAEQALILDYWQARHAQLGAVVGAVIVSQDVFTRLSFQHIKQQAQGALTYRLFEQEAEAAAWLAQQA